MADKDSLKRKKEEANQLVTELQSYLKSAEVNLEKSKTLLLTVEGTTNEQSKLNASLSKIISTTKEAITKFNAEKNRISKLLIQANEFYTKKYLPIANTILDKNNGIPPLLAKTKAAGIEIARIKETSSVHYDFIKKYAADLKRNNKLLQGIDTSITKLLNDVKSKSTSVNELAKSSKELEAKISVINTNLTKLFVDAQRIERAISTLLTKSQKTHDEITEIKIKGENILEEIRTIYGIAAETGLSGEFDKRGSSLKIALGKWELRILIFSSILFLLVVSLFIFQLYLYEWKLVEHSFDVNFYIRFLIVSPIIYYLYFCSVQYSQTNMLFEKYNFKTTLAMSIKHHIGLLISEEKFDNKERIDKILEFVLDGFKKIYTEPHTNEDYRLKLKIASIQLDVEKKLTDIITKVLETKSDSNIKP